MRLGVLDAEIGREIHGEKYTFKTGEGFSLDTLRLPKRIFDAPSPGIRFDEKYVRKAIDHAKKALLQYGAA